MILIIQHIIIIMIILHIGAWARPDLIMLSTGVCEQNNYLIRVLDMQSIWRNCSPVPDLALWRLIFPRVVFSGGVFLFTDTGMNPGSRGQILGVFNYQRACSCQTKQWFRSETLIPLGSSPENCPWRDCATVQHGLLGAWSILPPRRPVLPGEGPFRDPGDIA